MGAGHQDSVHTENAEGVDEIGASVAMEIRDADVKGDWSGATAGNLESEVGLRDVLQPSDGIGQAIDARKIENGAGERSLRNASLVASAGRVDDLDDGAERIWVGRLNEIVVPVGIELNDGARRGTEGIDVDVGAAGTGIARRADGGD